ncbi:MAG: ABC transporter permease [Spirochaetia bacterium]|jgi:ribose/xylose/arabinose/galactoside ABC-type transport system permease subunit
MSIAFEKARNTTVLKGMLNRLHGQRNVLLIYTIAVVIFTLSSIGVPSFLNDTNQRNNFRDSVGLGIVSIGQTFVVIGGNLDLSVGSIISLASCITSGIMRGRSEALVPVIVVVLLIGGIIGLVNGLVTVNLRVPSFITTFAMMSLIQGITLSYTKRPVGGVSADFIFFSEGDLLGVPFPVIFLIAIMILGTVVLKRKKFGRYLYALGGNNEFARLAGINVPSVVIRSFIISGVLAAASGLYFTSRMGIGDPNLGEGYELVSITAVVLGGAILAGGQGSLIGTYGGVIIVTLMSNVLNLMNISSFVQRVVQGLLLIIVVVIREQRRKER